MEELLSGGTLNRVVRIGDTVHRPAGPWTPAVHALLEHLSVSGYNYSPRPLGIDDRGREVLSYIHGQTVGWSLPWPQWIQSPSLLREVGAAAAALHRAVATFRPPPEAEWQSAGRGAIICHNDLAPYNAVCRDGHLVGFIDWDQAGPGEPVWDLAFVAWQWVPLHGPYVASLMGWHEPDRASRLSLLLDAYGLVDRAGFIDVVIDRILHNRSVMQARAAAGDPAYQALVDRGHLAGMDEALAFLAAEGAALQSAVG